MGNLGNDWVMLQVFCLSALHGCCPCPVWTVWAKDGDPWGNSLLPNLQPQAFKCMWVVFKNPDIKKSLLKPHLMQAHTSPVLIMDHAPFLHPMFLVILGIPSSCGLGLFLFFCHLCLHCIMLRSPLNLHMPPHVRMQTVRHYPTPWWGCSHLFSLAMCNVKGLPWVSWRRQ